MVEIIQIEEREKWNNIVKSFSFQNLRFQRQGGLLHINKLIDNLKRSASQQSFQAQVSAFKTPNINPKRHGI